jgi:hypothetical protein
VRKSDKLDKPKKQKYFLIVPGDEFHRIPKITVHVNLEDKNYVAEALRENEPQSKAIDSSPHFAALVAYQVAIDNE